VIRLIFKGNFATTILESWYLKMKAEIFLKAVLSNYGLPGARMFL